MSEATLQLERDAEVRACSQPRLIPSHSKCSRSTKVPGVTAQPPHHCKTPATSVGCDPREVTPRATKPGGGALGTDTIMRPPLLTHSRYFSQRTTRIPTGSVAQSQKRSKKPGKISTTKGEGTQRRRHRHCQLVDGVENTHAIHGET